MVKEQKRLSAEELLEIYEGEYALRYHARDSGRIARLIPLMNLDAGMTVADFGCANALLLDYVRGRVRRYNGLDFSRAFIDQATRRHAPGPDVAFHCESIESFCSAHRGELDCAFLLDVTEHIYDEDLAPMLKAIRMALRPGGRLFIHTPDRDFFLERLKEWGIRPQLPEHIAVRNSKQYRALLERCEYSATKVTHLSHYISSLAWLHLFSRVPIVGRFFSARLFIECRR